MFLGVGHKRIVYQILSIKSKQAKKYIHVQTQLKASRTHPKKLLNHYSVKHKIRREAKINLHEKILTYQSRFRFMKKTVYRKFSRILILAFIQIYFSVTQGKMFSFSILQKENKSCVMKLINKSKIYFRTDSNNQSKTLQKAKLKFSLRTANILTLHIANLLIRRKFQTSLQNLIILHHICLSCYHYLKDISAQNFINYYLIKSENQTKLFTI